MAMSPIPTWSCAGSGGPTKSGVYYSPYDGLGGVRVKLNDFNFNGTGTPFVPYNRRAGYGPYDPRAGGQSPPY